MDSDEGKLFIGGIAWDTTEERLAEYFSTYGDVSQTVIMRDKITGRPRGFGFVVFSDPSVLDRVVEEKHSIDGRMVEAKKALSREEQHSSSRPGNTNAGRNSGGGGNVRTKKIFVGGLPSTLTEDEFRMYFESYGQVNDVVIMYDQNTQRPRGFGFISFESEEAVEKVVQKSFHELNNKLVEVKRALPKDANPGGGGRGGGYQGGYGGSNTNSFDGRVDGNRYMQPQTTPGGFPPYSGYGAPSYGYGAANNPLGYGGYGSYGVASAGFGAPAGAYGNPNAAGAGYGSGAPGAMKNNWSSQSPSGYGYGAGAGYGSGAPWNASGGGGVSAPVGQSPSGVSGYGNQGYGYGGYGGSAPNSNVSAGGEQQGGGGYGDSNGSGYSNTAWRSDPSHAAGGYGGGYGSAQPRQS